MKLCYTRTGSCYRIFSIGLQILNDSPHETCITESKHRYREILSSCTGLNLEQVGDKAGRRSPQLINPSPHYQVDRKPLSSDLQRRSCSQSNQLVLASQKLCPSILYHRLQHSAAAPTPSDLCSSNLSKHQQNRSSIIELEPVVLYQKIITLAPQFEIAPCICTSRAHKHN